MASGPITSWQINGEIVETLSDFIFGGSKITADVNCSHEIKRHLLLGRKVITNLDSILKSRDITLPMKVHLVKAMVFLVVMYGCESWTKRKFSTEELMLLNCGVGGDSWEFLGNNEIQPVHSKGDQSWVFIGRTDAEAETPILCPPDVKNQHIGKDPNAGKDWRWEEKEMDDRWDGWMTPQTGWTWVWVSSGSWWWTGKPGVLQSMGSQRVGHDWETELNWTLP